MTVIDVDAAQGLMNAFGDIDTRRQDLRTCAS